MKSFLTLLTDLLLLAGAAGLGWYFFWTFVVIEGIAGITTFALRKVEKSWQ